MRAGYRTCFHTLYDEYIYIYILHDSVCDPGFHALPIRQKEWKIFKKRPINMIDFLFKGGFCLCVCVLLKVNTRAYVLSLAHTYMRIFAHIVACIFTYAHIIPLSIVGKGWSKGRECKKRDRRWGVGGERVVIVRIISFSLGSTELYDSWRFIWCEYEMSVLWWILLNDDDDDDDD